MTNRRQLRLDRRQALRLAAALGLSAAWPGRPAPAAAAIRTRPIPASGEALPVVGLGTWRQFDVDLDSPRLDQLEQVLGALFAGGGSVIDSSPMYGNAEAVAGKLLARMGAVERGFLATKVWTRGRAAGERQMRRSAGRLRADTIDLMQVHNLLDVRTHLRTLRTWKDAGRIRYLGITHYTVSALDDLAEVIRREPVDFVQLAHSVGVRAPEERLLPLAAERGVAVLVNRPFEGGGAFRRVRGRALPDWTAEFGCESWAQFFLKYVLAHPAVTCVIPGTSDPGHMRDNLGAGRGRLPDEAERRRMAALWEAL